MRSGRNQRNSRTAPLSLAVANELSNRVAYRSTSSSHEKYWEKFWVHQNIGCMAGNAGGWNAMREGS